MSARVRARRSAIAARCRALGARHDVTRPRDRPSASAFRDAAGGGAWDAGRGCPAFPRGRVLALDGRPGASPRRAGVRRGDARLRRASRRPPERAGARAEAERALSTAVDVGSPAQASRAGNLLGILAATDESVADVDSANDARPGRSTRRSAPTRRTSSAKYNLELLFRRIGVVGRARARAGSRRPRAARSRAPGPGAPGSGY